MRRSEKKTNSEVGKIEKKRTEKGRNEYCRNGELHG
jgi:hypothetical protein